MKRDIYLSERPLEEALRGYLEMIRSAGALKPGKPQKIPVQEAAGRVTAAPVYAANSSPHYHASAMDGIAVRSVDTFGASEKTPKRLRLGENAVMVDTGDPLPDGCDAVIMIEDVDIVGGDEFEIVSAATPWQHVRVIGEDIVATEMIIPANHRVRPIDIGGMLAGGVTEIFVHPAPRVGLIPTGTELVPPGSDLKPGDIVEYNTGMFASLVEEWGGRPVRYGIVPDQYDQLRKQVEKAVEECDIVLINAGSSAGREDFTAALIGDLGTVYTHGVAIKPGKPVILGMIRGKPVVGVPGYPVSAILGMELFVRPLVYGKLGSVAPARPRVDALASRKIVSSLGVEEFVRVKLGQVGDKVIATPISRGAGVIMSLIRADGILRVPRLSEGFNAGERVPVELLRPLEEVRETTVIIGSHDIALDVLANYLRVIHPEASLSSAHVGSLGGLAALKRGEAHCAGTHLLDEETGDYNVSYIRRLLPDRKMVLVNLVYREQGLIVAKGNPKGIGGVRDLAREGISYINRQRGAGTRILLDFKLRETGIDPQKIHGYEREEYTHMAVAAAVASGSADAGMGIRAAAKALDLDFVSVVEERYDLCIPAEYMDTPHIARLLEVMQMEEFRTAVKDLGGYDLRDCGRIMWESS
ncbi:MAG: molybdopterin biosynthesis protein [Peptococcaceae bacterium]|nr:molybdopterin biosynthesis protein [Peptococcaceae bacterium]